MSLAQHSTRIDPIVMQKAFCQVRNNRVGFLTLNCYEGIAICARSGWTWTLPTSHCTNISKIREIGISWKLFFSKHKLLLWQHNRMTSPTSFFNLWFMLPHVALAWLDTAMLSVASPFVRAYEIEESYLWKRLWQLVSSVFQGKNLEGAVFFCFFSSFRICCFCKVGVLETLVPWLARSG